MDKAFTHKEKCGCKYCNSGRMQFALVKIKDKFNFISVYEVDALNSDKLIYKTEDVDEILNAEKENKFVPGSLYSYVPNNGNNEIGTYWSELQTLIANIENKTVTDKSYKFISDDGSTRIFEITVPVKVEKDSNGKTINLNVNKVCKFTVFYNNTSATDIRMDATYYADIITNYELNY